MSRLINADDILSMAHDVILQNGAKHRCFDVTMLHEIPTVEAPVWIPVKERIPIKRQDCLVTYIVKSNAKSGFTWRLMGCATFIPELFSWADYHELYGAINDGISYGWVSYDVEDGCYYRLENVIAWMELPKPYKEVKE